MSERYRRSRGRRRPAPRPRTQDDESVWDDEGDAGHDEYEEAPPPRRGRRPAPAARRSRPAPRRRAPSGGGFFSRLLGGSKPPRRGASGGFDWSAADDYDVDDGYEDEYVEQRRAPRRRPGGARRRRAPEAAEGAQSLMDLCTPLFGYAALLPRRPGGVQPGYEAFRQQIVSALRRIQDDAAKHGIEREDAEHASYALALFIDEAVAGSEWDGKSRWSSEPLHITMHGDPEGGVNFFRRLDSLGDRQVDVKAVYLVCLALGFRGKFVELDATQQVARIAEYKEKVVRGINRVPLDRRDMLFPQAYRPANPIEDDVPPPPRWWIAASLGTLAVLFLVWIVMFVMAGRRPAEAEDVLRGIPTTTTSPQAAPPAVPGAGETQG